MPQSEEPGSSNQYKPQNSSDPLEFLSAASYTAHRLKHATPEHLYLTTRRCFVGPIPEGWLKNHRRDWYKRHVHYSSRSISFSASANTGSHRRLTGIDAPNNATINKHSFPQPRDIVEDPLENRRGLLSKSEPTVVAEEPAAIERPLQPGQAASVPDAQSTQSGTNQPATSFGTTPRAVELGEQPHVNVRETGQPAATSNLQAIHSPPIQGKQPNLISEVSVKSRPKFKPSRNQSWHTAHENLEPLSSSPGSIDQDKHAKTSLDSQANDTGRSSANDGSFVRAESVGASSTAPLLDHKLQGHEEVRERTDFDTKEDFITDIRPDRIQERVKFSESESHGALEYEEEQQHNQHISSGLVRFNLPQDDEDAQKEQLLKLRLAQFRRRDTLKRLRKGKVRAGEILKMEKMLVRVEYTSHAIQEEFDENDSQKIESRTLDKWREFVVVCRECNEDDEYTLQMYSSRVIRAVEKTSSKKRIMHQLILNSKTGINLFSSLDKTIVLWEPYKQGYRIFIVRPRSGAHSMEWYTFLRSILGWTRPSTLQINVPDLKVSLMIDHPFENLESTERLAKAAEGDQEALAKTIEEEKAVAGKIIVRCMKMLEGSEFGSIIDAWAAPPIDEGDTLYRVATPHGVRIDTGDGLQNSFSSTQGQNPISMGQSPVGLAWKRYDRLEWVYGANEQSMYGTMGMERSHDLELRPKQHYPTIVVDRNGKHLLEPPPVEGFLIRLTSQRGREKKLGKLFYKRLYFSTHNQYLVFNRPGQADPPTPPALTRQVKCKIPSVSQIAGKVPLIYAVNPYPLTHGKIQWLALDESNTAEEVIQLDQDAYDENERKVNLLLKCDGIIDLCNVVRVRKMRRGANAADDIVDQGTEESSDENATDGDEADVEKQNEKRTFEMVLKNGLVVRLQAYDKKTKREWIRRVRSLVSYWKLRKHADIELYKSVRRLNLEYLNIDEDVEAAVGQFASKWEVKSSYASPELYHMCGISCCRTVQMAGVLYRKPHLHASFERSQVILSHGHLLVFQAVERNRNGLAVPHIHHQRMTSLELSECYIYSGLITSDDLLYTSSGGAAPDRSHPGSHRGLPRYYFDDDWSSTDADTMTCFVVWHGKRRSWFRTEKAQGRGQEISSKVKMVRALGKQGRAVVFKARSRAERDHWVMSIGMEIERVATNEDFRIVE